MKLKQTYRGNNFEILLVNNIFGKHFLWKKPNVWKRTTKLCSSVDIGIPTLDLMQMFVVVLNRENPGHGIKKIAVKTESKEEKKGEEKECRVKNDWRGEKLDRRNSWDEKNGEKKNYRREKIERRKLQKRKNGKEKIVEEK